VTTLRRRLGKLEAQLIDGSGLVPHSRKWLEYWERWLERYSSDPDFQPQDLMPIEAARAIIAGSPNS
jgi:hypothetical protein